jgi:hypothetical protein
MIRPRFGRTYLCRQNENDTDFALLNEAKFYGKNQHRVGEKVND